MTINKHGMQSHIPKNGVFRSALCGRLLGLTALKGLFKTHIPFDIKKETTEVIIDGLKYVHIPPSPKM